MKRILILLLSLISIWNVAFAVPNEGNITIDSEGEHCLYIYTASQVKWDTVLIESGPHPSTWTADTAAVLLYRDGLLIKSNIIAGNLGRFKVLYERNGNYQIEVIVEYKADSGCRDCVTQHPSKTFYNKLLPVLVDPIEPTSPTPFEIGTDCDFTFSSTVSCGTPGYKVVWTNSQGWQPIELIYGDAPIEVKYNTSFQTAGDANIRIDVTDDNGNGDYGGKSKTIKVHEKMVIDWNNYSDSEIKISEPQILAASYTNTGCTANPLKNSSTITTSVKSGYKIGVDFPLDKLPYIGKFLPEGSDVKAEYEKKQEWTKSDTTEYVYNVPPCTKGYLYISSEVVTYKGTWTNWDCTTKTTGDIQWHMPPNVTARNFGEPLSQSECQNCGK